MLNVLVIEDDDSVAQTVADAVRDKVDDANIRIEQTFASGAAALVDRRPDVVILDLIEGDPQAGGERTGDQIWEDIWKHHFRPVVIYSAIDLPFDLPNTPFVAFVQKGKGSDLEVAAHIEALKPHIDSLRDVDEEIRSVVRHVLKTVARHIFDQEPDDEQKKGIVVRAVRRRVAAMMDEGMLESDEPMHGWEQYIVPAFGEHLLTADILREVGADGAASGSYVVVLTASCDMVLGRANCVEKVLVAKCHDVEKYLNAVNLTAGAKPETIANKLQKVLTQAQFSGKLLLFDYPGNFPMMTLDLRDLDLIDRKSIGNSGSEGIEYERAASIDSPFREQIAWAYHQDSGRPGLPERSFEAVIKAVVAQRNEGN